MNKSIKSLLLLTTLLVLLVSISSVNAVDIDNQTSISHEDTTTGDLSSDIESTSDNIITDNKVSTANKRATKTIEDKKVETKKKVTANKTIKTTDEVDYYVSDSNGQDTNDGSKDNPFKTIQTAINKTTADSIYNIHITEGTYKGAGNTNLSVNGNYNINFIGDGINVTFIDGEANYTLGEASVWGGSAIWNPYLNGTGNYIMNITNGTGLITLTNFTIQHSWVYAIDGGDSISKYPTATVDNYGNLKVDNMYFYQNYAGVGAGIRNNANGTLSVNNTIFDSNRKSESTGNFGAGVYNKGLANITNSVFTNNSARWGTVTNDGQINITNCLFKDGISYNLGSTFKYGSGIASNTGGADFYNPYGVSGLITNVNNCTFVNNGQTDIYQGVGKLDVVNSSFLNSTGIYLTYTSQNLSVHHNIINNTFINSQPSSIFGSLTSSSTTTFAIYSTNQINTTIENNIINSQTGYGIYATKYTTIKNNTLNRYIYLNNGNNTITDNNIQVSDLNYTIALKNSNAITGNIITNNYLITNKTMGDNSVNKNRYSNTIENNTPIINDGDLFVSPNVTTAKTGTMTNPTTLTDAISRINNTNTIHLLIGNNGLYSLDNTVTLNSTNLNTNTTTIRINGYTNNGNTTQITGQDLIKLFNVTEGYSLILNNVVLSNGQSDNGGLIYSEGNLTITNSTLKDSYAANGGAIYTTGNANTTLTNNKFINITSLNETLNLNSESENTLADNYYENCDIELKEFTIIGNSGNPNPIKVNDTINVDINSIILENPSYYDENILANITYAIYKNDELIDTTTQKTYSLYVTSPDDITTYIIPSFSNEKSNTLTFTVPYTQLRNVTTNTEDILAFTNDDITITTILTDEFGVAITDGTVSYYNGNTLLGSSTVTDGKANITIAGYSTSQELAITVCYNDTTNKYYNNVNTTTITIDNAIYVSPTTTTAQTGTKTNPTTLIDAVNRIKDNRTIILTSGTYNIDSTIYINENTTKATKFNITGLDNVVLTGNTTIFNITNVDVALSNCNFTNTTSLVSETTNVYGKGGVICNSYSSIIINNCNFTNNKLYVGGTQRVYAYGGAIYTTYSNMTLINSNFNNNNINSTATSSLYSPVNTGGAIYTTYSNITISNTAFNNNTKKAVYISYANKVTITNTNFTSNHNGGLSVSYSDLTITNTNFINNNATNGGAISGSYSNLTVTNNTFKNNTANQGGAIYTDYSNLTITNDIFLNNTAKNIGGSLFITSDAKSKETIIQDSLFINSTSNRGGAIRINYGNITIENNKFINVTKETIELVKTNKTMHNNTYTNCTIDLNIIITLNESTQYPINLKDNVNLIINTTILHPEYYDDNLKLENITYDIYMNDILIKHTEEDVTNYNITPNTVGDITTYVYVNKNNLNSTSNIILLDVELNNLQNTIINAPSILSYYKESATLTVTVTNKTGTLVTDGGIVELYDENNQLIGTNTTINGIATIHTTTINKIGLNNITIKYIGTEGIYNNQTNTTTIMTLASDVYASPDITIAQEGTITNPTTIQDALTKIRNDGTIHLLYGTDGIYNLNETIKINTSSVQEEVQSINFIAETPITLDGNNTMQIININKTINTSFTNITFTKGNATNGGAIYSTGNITFKGKTQFIKNMAFTNNYSIKSYGGAIYTTGNIKSTGEITFNNNQVKGFNSIVGGAIYSTGNITLNGINTFNNNQVNGVICGGGAIYHSSSTSTILLNGTNIFINNKVNGSSSSGGIIDTNGLIIIQGENTFENNTVKGKSGIIEFSNTKSTEFNGIIITGHTIFNNNSAPYGGAIYNQYGNLIITNVTFINNNATYGGAIYQEKGNLTVTNSTFINNTATQYGGAIYTTNTQNVTIKNNTFINITGETLYLPNTSGNKIISDNTYNNCTIRIRITIALNEQTSYPIKVNDTVNLTIKNLTPFYADYYDNNLNLDNNVFNITYDVYMNDAYVKQTEANAKNFTIIPATYGDVKTYITLKDNATEISNTLTLDVEIYNLHNTVINVPEVISYYQESATMTVTVTNKTGVAVLDGGMVEVYDENNQLIGTNTTINGIATIHTTPINKIGTTQITIKYITTDGIYNNQTNTSYFITAMSDVYVSPDIATAQEGTISNPTTLADALTKIANKGTIHLLYGTSGTYTITDVITIATTTTLSEVNTFNITAETPVVLKANKNQIFYIEEGYDITITNITFNSGAIDNEGNLTIYNTNIINNAGKSGGAIFNEGNLTIYNTNIINNTATQYGGAIYNNGIIIINNATFINNTATQYGGAIDNHGDLIITNTIFISNTANRYGGAIRNSGSTSYLIITNSTFTNNTATQYGGAIYKSTGNLIITNNIFINNSAKTGNVIYSTSTLTDINNKVYNQTVFELHRENNTAIIKINIINYSNKYSESTQGILNVYNGNELLYSNTKYTTGTDSIMSLESLEPGTYNFTITFTSEDNNLTNLTTIQEVATKMKTILVIENEDSTTINKTTTINITLLDENGVALPDRTINLQIGNAITTLQTNATGQAQYEYTSQKADTNTINATFNGDNDYISSIQISTITVNKISTTVTLSNITTSIGKNTTLTAKIVDENGNPVNGGRVAFKVNGITIKDSEGNTIYAQVVNGTAQITTSFNLRNKYYTLSVVYSGNSEYESLRANSTLTLLRKECAIVLDSPATATIGEEITLKLTITDDDAVINSGKAVFKLNGKTLRDTDGNVIYTKVVNNTATLKYTLTTKLSAKTYNITAVYGSSSTYNRTETTNKITLTKPVAKMPLKTNNKNSKTTIYVKT